MDIRQRNNVQVTGDGPVTLLLAHGFGCDQNMWRFVAPAFHHSHRVVLFDYVGCGNSDLAQYDPGRYSTLDGYATDLIEVADEFRDGPLVLVGHSVSAMIGLLADKRVPGLFDAHVMIGPSPSYIDDGDYIGGFAREDIEELLATLEGNYLGWSSNMAPAIMGVPDRPELSQELTNSFCRTDPDIAARFARATFLSNNLADLGGLAAPTLILQSTDDMIAPRSVGEYLHRTLPNSQLRLVDNIGHCPHMSAPAECVAEIRPFLAGLQAVA
ncbi:MAG: alpha/beta hydrolase [Lysobacteraceae bacterium]|nr:MAG: alpha/beta hydrolase [Xanthomonadaceae bacterium]